MTNSRPCVVVLQSIALAAVGLCSELALAQTPQAFRAEYGERLAALLSGPDEFTDEAAALESLGVDVALVPGDAANFKVTLPEDLRRAAAILDQGGGSQ